MDFTKPIVFSHPGTRNHEQKINETKYPHWSASFKKNRSVELTCLNPELDIKILAKYFCMWMVLLHGLKYKYNDIRVDVLMLTYVNPGCIPQEPVNELGEIKTKNVDNGK